MIRIDEIYENTFWAWLRQHRRGIRSYHCFPIGSSSPESVQCHGTTQVWEHNYILFFDVEPIHLDRFRPTFEAVRYDFARDIHDRAEQPGIIITSEHDSQMVEQVCSMYGWSHRHYFFWGWAALDWYRGYNMTFLMPKPQDRKITRTFIAPNRIVGGARRHRVELLYWIFKQNLTNSWISCPATCPVEGTSILDIVRPLTQQYPDMVQVFERQQLPMNFPGETGHPMHSCWLSLFDQAAECLVYLVSETVATGRRHQLTEKIFKPICLQMPFVLHSTQGSLAYLRSYGLRTFDHLWDESYDLEPDDQLRTQKIAQVLADLHSLSQPEQQQLAQAAQAVCEHNYDHFYSGAFEQRLWQEMTDLLESLPL